MGRRFTEIKSIIYKDIYRMRKFPPNYFDVIIDIGANLGTFTMLATVLNPSSIIYALEPEDINYNHLKDNLNKFRINVSKLALGDGTDLYCKPGTSLGNVFQEDDLGHGKTKSVPLTELWKTFQIASSHKVYFKIDCEGGERFLLNDHYSIACLRQCMAIGMELHFKPEPENDQSFFKDFPSFETYKEWLYEHFDHSHKIEIFGTNMGRGVCMVYMLRKDCPHG